MPSENFSIELHPLDYFLDPSDCEVPSCVAAATMALSVYDSPARLAVCVMHTAKQYSEALGVSL